MDLFNIFKLNLHQTLNEIIVNELNGCEVDEKTFSSSLRRENGSEELGDFTILFINPSIAWLSDKLEILGKLICVKSHNWSIPIKLFKIKSNSVNQPGIILYLDRAAGISSTLHQLLDEKMNYSSEATDVVIIQCFSNNVNEWVNLRSHYYSESLNSSFKLLGNHCLVETVDLDEMCTRCTMNVLCEIFTDDEKNQCLFEENGEKVIEVSHLKHKIKPALTFNKIYVKKDLSVLCKASSLRNLIYGRRSIFVVPHSLLVKCQKLIALLLLIGKEDAHKCIFQVGNVRCVSDVTQFKACLRSTLQEQCANTIEHDKENLLLDTCLKYNLLSVSNKSEVTVDQNSYKEPIFHQYNNARLSAILTKHANTYPPLALFEEIDWNCVFGDSEWKLLFNHLFVSQSVLIETMNNDSLPLHKVAQHLSAMIREFSLYYSKTKVLIAPQPQSLSLISSRIYFMKAIYKTLNRYFQCLSIIGVTKM